MREVIYKKIDKGLKKGLGLKPYTFMKGYKVASGMWAQQAEMLRQALVDNLDLIESSKFKSDAIKMVEGVGLKVALERYDEWLVDE